MSALPRAVLLRSALPLAVLALAACAGGPSPARTTGPTPKTSHASPPPAAATTSAPRPTPTSPRAAAAVLVLEPGGLGLTSGASIRHVPFGTDIVTVTNALQTTLGPVTRSTQGECGQGPRVQLSRQGFSALFEGVSFVGWLDSGRHNPRLTTVNGIGVGSTLAQIRSALPGTTVRTSTLGPEWTTPDGGLGGLLDGTAATSTMTNFYAGETCFFR